MPRLNVSLFSQIVSLLDRNVFGKIVRELNTDKHSKGINSWTHLISMLFCHLAGASSVREISMGLKSATGNLSHLGVLRAPGKSTVSYINKHRDWRLFRDFYFTLLDRYQGDLEHKRQYAIRLKRKIFIMDSTVVPLCMKLFDWALFRSRKGAVKLHTILDYDTSLPVFVHMTEGRKHDLTVARQLDFPSGSVLVIDRAYVDFNWLYKLDSSGVFFVTRLKKGTHMEVIQSYLANDKHEHILSDEDIRLTGLYTARKYPEDLRIVRVYDKHLDREFTFLTNQMSWTANTISELYKARWDIEVFFKHIKGALRIKTFVGTSPNAVLIQVWTAMIAILVLKYLKTKARFGWNLFNLVSFLRINLFVKIDLWHWIDEPYIKNHSPPEFATLFS